LAGEGSGGGVGATLYSFDLYFFKTIELYDAKLTTKNKTNFN